MAFPTIPTVAAGRVLVAVQADTTATRTFPSLTGLTKNAGDRLIAICIAYQTSTGTNAAFSGWTGSFGEIHDSATSTTMAIGVAEKISTGSETGTVAVTQAGTITGHACFILMSIPGAHASSPSEVGGRTSGVNSNADGGAFDPSWPAEDILWIAVCGNGETATGGSWQGIIGGPASYTDVVLTGQSADVVGGVEGGVAFQQLNADSEDPAAWNTDLTNARWGALTIAVRPPPLAFTGTVAVTLSAFTSSAAGELQITGTADPTLAAFTSSADGTVSSATVPDAVDDLAATPGDTEVDLTWTAPADGGASITDYVVQFRVQP